MLLIALFLAGSHACAHSLSLSGSLTLPACTAVDAVGSTVFTANASDFVVLNASNPAMPTVIGQVGVSGSISAIAAVGHYAYCAAQGNGLIVLLVADPTNPSLVTRYNYASSVRGVDAFDSLVAMATTASTVLLGVRDPGHPHILATYGRQGSWVQFDPAGNRMHVGSSAGAFDLSIVLTEQGTDTTYSLVNHHTYGTAGMTPLALVGDYVDAASGAALIDVQSSDYSYMAQYQAGAAIRAVAGIPTFAFIGINSGTVIMLDQRRGLPELPVSVGIPDVPTGMSPGQSGNQHILAVSHNAGISILTYDTSSASAGILPAIPTGFSLNVYPNPFNPVAQIEIIPPQPGRYTLAIYDVLGREIEHESLMLSGKTQRTLDMSLFSPGMYFARLSNPNFAIIARLIYLP